MLFPGTSRFKDARMLYLELLRFLNGRHVDIDSIVRLASAYLPQTELASRSFLEICIRLEMKGYLGPDKLDVLKLFFPTLNDTIAFTNICETEKEIKGQ